MANMETSARSVDPLVVGKVIGDVLDMFVPVVDFTVEYASKQISNNGVEIKPAEAAQKPRVHIKGSLHSNNLYTLVRLIIYYLYYFKSHLRAIIKLEFFFFLEN